MLARSTQPQRLPLRCTPEANESLTGFILRVARSNHFENSAPIVTAAGIGKLPVFFPSAGQLDALAIMTGLETDVLARLACIRVLGSSLKKQFKLNGLQFPRAWLPEQRRACPLCLAKSPYHRVVWDLCAVRACGVHGCELLEACPAGHPLDWRQADLTRCRCGENIARATTPECDPRLALAADWIGGGLTGGGGRPPCLLTGVPLPRAIKINGLVGALLLGRSEKEALESIGPSGHECQAVGYGALDSDIGQLNDAVRGALGRKFGPERAHSESAASAVAFLCRLTGPSMFPLAMMIEAHS